MVDNLPGSAKKPGHYFPVTFFRANSLKKSFICSVPYRRAALSVSLMAMEEVKHVGNTGAQGVV
jgi:hypothetical protein